MFIKYNDTNVHALPYVTTRKKRMRNRKTGAVRIVDAVNHNQSPSDVKWLRPGWNEFPRDVWEQNKAHPGVVKMLEDKKIEIMSDVVTVTIGKKKVKKTIGQDDEPISLELFSENRAIEIIKDTLNRDMLERWLDEETRHKVKRALRKQIEPLLPNEKKDDDEE